MSAFGLTSWGPKLKILWLVILIKRQGGRRLCLRQNTKSVTGEHRGARASEDK